MIKIKLIYFLVLSLSMGFPLTIFSQSNLEYVDPFIGTSNFGATNPGAVVPQGMVSVTPFNVTGSEANMFDKDKRWWSMPFAYENTWFTGYSHVNLSGVGCPDLGVILLMPTTGPVVAAVENYGSTYSNQLASPGYYSNYLNKYGIKTEVTASQRGGLSRFTFPKGQSNILLNLGTGLTNETGASLRIVNDREIEGSRMTGSFCYNDGSERPVYFVLRFSQKADGFGAWKKMPKMQAEDSWSSTSGKYKYYSDYQYPLSGDDIGAWFSFSTKADESIMVKVGISYVSTANARENLDAEIPDFNFEKTHQTARERWEEVLSCIEVEGGTKEQKTIFYTSLYHINLHPNVLNDINGQYPMMESYGVGQLKNQNRYTVFSLWDTYRNVHPFLSLVYPDLQLDMMRSVLDMYRESGWMPKWELNSRETHVMEGDPAIPMLVDSYLRGIRFFDMETAYEGMYKSATTRGVDNKLRPDIDPYLEKGYVPLEEEFDNSVSHALEYYIADWNLAQIAKVLNKEADYQRFYQQSLRYGEYFDPEFNMIRPKLANGEFLTPFDPHQGENFEPCPGFHEGTAWQYTFYVPHDIPGLMELMGGKKVFVNTLQKVFDEGLFDMANEPDINYPYLFNYAKGEEWRTQKEVNRLINTHYKATPGGIPGNDDCGTLSAWLVFSMMGFYPVCPGDMDYAITSPIFDKITLHLSKGGARNKKLVISTIKESPSSVYIKKMTRNGQRWKDYFISHQELTEGGELTFYLKD